MGERGGWWRGEYGGEESVGERGVWWRGECGEEELWWRGECGGEREMRRTMEAGWVERMGVKGTEEFMGGERGCGRGGGGGGAGE